MNLLITNELVDVFSLFRIDLRTGQQLFSHGKRPSSMLHIASIEILKSERRWNDLAAGMSEDKLRRNPHWLADWIEADIAYAVFVCNRSNQQIFSDNPIKKLAALIATWWPAKFMRLELDPHSYVGGRGLIDRPRKEKM